ncbi:LOB domain-containing protein 27 [Phtheirospermum japonicum]|uniref:LOB domain-containing protein 27 n=1 Tax=Phtheirospermum japonicum TaxID=374723 RepID=A0A830BZ94_9LAMI|nr:LOB domain-containing protein 27 [Phtheirospermum japonicum]
MTVKGGTTPACAVCKYQRRKCSPNCPLAPYFPANQTKMFQNVHRLFGVSNITKILESLNTEDQKEDAMKSIIYEAEMRHRFPVHGCSVIICQLRLQLHRAVDELRCVYAQIAACKEQLNNNHHHHHHHQLGFGPSTQMDVGTSFQIQSIENEAYPGFLNENPFSNEMDMINHDNNNLAAIQAQLNAFGIQQEEKSDNYFQDFEGVDDRQSYVVTKSRYQQSI